MGYSQSFIDQHRDINVDHDWWDADYEDFHRICKILGIEVDKDEPAFSGFASQGDGASWTGTYWAQYGFGPEPIATYDLAPQKIREYAPTDEVLHTIADELCLLARIYHPVVATVRRHDSRYAHSMTMCVSEWDYYDDIIGSEGVDDDIAELIEETLLTQFRALADWLYATLEVSYDYLTSDEAVIASLEANDIEEDE